MEGRFLYFEKFRLDVRTGELVKEGRTVRLPPQPTKLLLLLTRSPGTLISHEEIQRELWGEDTFVDFEQAVKKCVKQVRTALGDDVDEPVYVETVPRRGYRFIGPLREDGEVSPYPGLAAFSESDARFFFGREGEAEALWNKIARRKLLALIGPSGAGKSSFLRAGLLPSRREGWRVEIVTPGSSRLSSLPARDMSDGPFLLVVDAFEELFTRNPPEVQREFAERLGSLSREKDTHVLLSMRDDFLFRCHEQDSLQEVFLDITPLGPLSEAALKQALEKPAAACGYRFEERLVEEMVREVEKLPLLAFAAAQLWEKRDRGKKVLSRAAYDEIGRVGGALAQHAERTLQSIGNDGQSTVREIFRNVTTSQGMRVAMGREELLSVFPDRKIAADVLAQLIDARLLTSSSGEVEIVHESLLAAWPRLVQWQAQDEEGLVLRDQLRQAARLWEERGRTHDLLWTGSSFREFSLWRERYAGGLTILEEDYTKAMTARASRTRRRRQLAVIAALVTTLTASTFALALWRNAEGARQLAEEEARNREAAQLVSLGRLRLEDHPSAALAYALASLERTNNVPARRFAVEALWRGPTEFIWGTEGGGTAPGARFSGDGRFLAYGSMSGARLLASGGGPSRTVGDQNIPFVDFSGDSRLVLVSPQGKGPLRIFSTENALEVHSLPLADGERWFSRGDRVLTVGRSVQSLPLSGGTPRVLGAWDNRDVTDFDVTWDGSRIAAARGGQLQLLRLDRLAGRAPARTDGDELTVKANRARAEVATIDREGRRIRLWSVEGDEPRLERELDGLPSESIEHVVLDPRGRFVSAEVMSERSLHRLWDMEAPPDVEPLALRDRDTEGWLAGRSFDPSGRWLAVGHDKYGSLWALHEKRPRVLRGLKPPYKTAVGFTPDGRYLVSGTNSGEFWRWSLSPSNGSRLRLFYEKNHWLGDNHFSFDPHGRFALVSDYNSGRVLVIPLDGTVARAIDVPKNRVSNTAIRRDGRIMAVGLNNFGEVSGSILIRDLETGEERTLNSNVEGESCEPSQPDAGMVDDLLFLRDGSLLTVGLTGLRVFDLTTGTSTRLRPCQRPGGIYMTLALAPDDRTVLIAIVTDDPSASELAVFDLETRAERSIGSHGDRVSAATLDPAGLRIVTGSSDGLVRVGPLNRDGEPHLLYGHTALVTSVAVSSDSRWIASASEDGTIRLWPMPEGEPFHTLPYEEILSRIRALTNLRVVPDVASDTGYRVQIGPFPGWKKLPAW